MVTEPPWLERDPGTVEERSDVSRSNGIRQVIHVVSDGTGRSEDEVVLLFTVAATAAATVAAWRGIAWAVETLTNWDPWPSAPRGLRG